MFPLADRDAARQRALVVVDAIVGDFQVMGPSVHQDAAAALGTVDDRQAVNSRWVAIKVAGQRTATIRGAHVAVGDRKSTRLNSSHGYISYAVFCLKKKKKLTVSLHVSC